MVNVLVSARFCYALCLSAKLDRSMYLCIVLELFDKRVVGWSMHHQQDRQMFIRAVKMAIWQRQQSYSVIPHSDRGNQFRSGDNAACEGFFGVLKREWIYRVHFQALDAARRDVFEYIDRIHNPRMWRRTARQDLRFTALFKPSVERG